ncbi:unnamed protein product [Rhizoctonia solani]|uniref:Laminin domain protein n=1 Tax=Rhizoctonia solani TaxID=456999 RepID=A0A8H3DPY4_9AGAM|nr:unnamed protein product [Rhizoctonia solani]
MAPPSSKKATSSLLTYAPPLLPDYLKNVYTLKTIVGVPTSDDVIEIHADIHAFPVPNMANPEISAQLAQFLFSVQMAVYRNEYPLSAFPTDNTYTPPTIPSHISISLNPVVGAPSDEELESAHGAVRIMENLANTPFIFDPTLSTKLSQHLFNIQFARYLQDSTQGEFSQAPVRPHTPYEEPSPVVPNVATPESHTSDIGAQETTSVQSGPCRETDSDLITNRADPEPNTMAQPSPCAHEPEIIPQNMNCDLSRVVDLLIDIRRTLVATYNGMVRNAHSHRQHTVMNEKGELPWLNGLPYISPYSRTTLFGTPTESEVVSYLKWYSIGGEFVETDERISSSQVVKPRPTNSWLGFYVIVLLDNLEPFFNPHGRLGRLD